MFTVRWSSLAAKQYEQLKEQARCALENRLKARKTKSSKQEGLFAQVHKAIELLGINPRHPSLNTHEYDSLANLFTPGAKVFEAYAQNNTPGAWRIFWCYGPKANELTIMAITPHP